MSDPKTPFDPSWMKRGKALRDNRVGRMESLNAAAARMGVSPRLLCDVEHGRADPLALLFPELARRD